MPKKKESSPQESENKKNEKITKSAKEEAALKKRSGVKESNEQLKSVGASIARIPTASGFGLRSKRPQVRNYDPTGTIFIDAKDKNEMQYTPRERALMNLRAGMDPSTQTIFRGKVVGSGTVKLNDGSETTYAKVNTTAGVMGFSGKIVNIPFNEFKIENGTPTTNDSNANAYINARKEAEVEFIVYHYNAEDKNGGIILGSRVKAADKKKMKYWFGKQDYKYLLYPGRIIEASVVGTSASGITVEVAGIEFFIPGKELSYVELKDCRDRFANGQRIKVKIKDLKRKEGYKIEAGLSHKESMEDTRIDDMQDWLVGEVMKKVPVKDVRPNPKTGVYNIWATYEGKFDIFCKMREGISIPPQKGEYVDIVINGKSLDGPDGPRMWGEVFHVYYNY